MFMRFTRQECALQCQAASSTHCGNHTWCIKLWVWCTIIMIQKWTFTIKSWKHWHKHALRNAPRALLRSMVNWFTEFCNSQWLLHFAAPFINMWTKTSVAESIHAHCSKLNTLWVYNVNHWCTTVVHWTHNSRLSTGLAPVHQPTITVVVWSHEWSFRRFTYGNLVTTSPSSKW